LFRLTHRNSGIISCEVKQQVLEISPQQVFLWCMFPSQNAFL
jgi:hypothetical protein